MFRAVFILSVLLFIFLSPVSRIYAQTEDEFPPFIRYINTINYDDEEKGLLFPSFVHIDPATQEIYVIDGKSRVIIYSPDYFPLYTLGKGEGVEAPQGLTVDEQGYIYIAQAATKENPRWRISVFDPIFEWEGDIYPEGFEGADKFRPYRLAVDKKGLIYVAGINFPGILVIDKSGNFQDIITRHIDNGPVTFNNIVIEKGKILLVSDAEGAIIVLDENRNFLFKFGIKGGAERHLSQPQSVSMDDKGRLYVVDYMRQVVVAYDHEGKWLFEFGGMGWGHGWFQFPKGIAIDDQDRMYVTDIFNNRVEVFQIDLNDDSEVRDWRDSKRLARKQAMLKMMDKKSPDDPVGN